MPNNYFQALRQADLFLLQFPQVLKQLGDLTVFSVFVQIISRSFLIESQVKSVTIQDQSTKWGEWRRYCG